MNDGVALLLERMKTNPEEFTGGKWNALIQSHKMFLNKEDCEALDVGVNALMQQQFTEKVLEELVDPKSEGEDRWGKIVTPLVGSTTGHYNTGRGYQSMTGAYNTAIGNLAPNSATLTIGNQTLDESTLEHMKAHLDALKREVANQKPKEHKTIFGKLFNYQ